MSNITPTPPQTQEQQISQFRYVSRLTPERVKSLSPLEKEEALIEFLTLFSLILSVIYNPVAKEATRLLALDVIVTQVQRSARKLITAVTEKSPTYAPETEKRLGLSKNTISSGYKRLEKAGVLKRIHRHDEITRQEHLDIQPTVALFTKPSVIQDKKKREAPKPKLEVKPVDLTKQCLECDSPNLRITCRDCGSYIDLGEVKHTCQVEEDKTPASEQVIETTLQNPQEVQNEPIETEEEETHHKNCDDPNTSNIPTILVPETFDEGEETPITPPHAPKGIIATWLKHRIGEGQMIYATGQTDQNEKYKTFPLGYRPNIAAYLRGNPRHMYGSRLGTRENTRVLGFDIDDPERDARIDVYLQQLTQAGAFPLYWQRQNNRGHLEVYFSESVNAEAAYRWCVRGCPELASIPECYPVKDKKSNGFSWPLYQRVGESVYECPVSYWTGEGLETIAGVKTDPYAVETLVELAVTPASLIHVLPKARTDHPPDGLEPPEGDGGVLLEKPLEVRPSDKKPEYASPLSRSSMSCSSEEEQTRREEQSFTDLADVVIAEFNESHTWEEIAALCGGLRNNRFCAVWRGEKHASVVIDPDGRWACDHGRIGTYYLKKLDKYEVWCLAQGRDKTRDLAERIAVYRKSRRVKDGEQLNNPPLKNTAPQEYQSTPASELAKKMVNYEVLYLPHVPCTCGCELWRPVLGDFECCRCSPHPLWPNKYDQAIRELYPQSRLRDGI